MPSGTLKSSMGMTTLLKRHMQSKYDPAKKQHYCDSESPFMGRFMGEGSGVQWE